MTLPTHATTSTPTNPGAADSVDLDWLSRRIDYRLYQDCVHCGLCTASCPTYVETANENDSPRGRIYLMRAVADGRLGLSPQVRSHIELCLDCRACESACPSGVKYGQIIEPFKIAALRARPVAERAGWIERFVLQSLFPHAGRVRAALWPARVLQRMGVLELVDRVGLTRLLPSTLQRMQAMLPRLSGSRGSLPEVLPPVGPRRARVALFLGCVADAMFPETNAATARVLQQNGCEVVVPRTQGCCGAIHYHSGEDQPALEFARANPRNFPLDDIDAVIVNAAGCGAMLKEYPHLFPRDDPDHALAARFASKVKDVSEFLVALGPIPPRHRVERTVTYHDACHLCHAQQIRAQPRALLGLIPGLRLVPLEESELCCGAAGTYNLTQPEMAERLGARKVGNIRATGAGLVVTGNVGCILQIGRCLRDEGLDVEVAHPIDLLDRAYRGPNPR